MVEYAPHGNLRDFLRDHRPPNNHGYETPVTSLGGVTSSLGGGERKVLTFKNLLSFTYQVARGMEYLSLKMVRFASVCTSFVFCSLIFCNAANILRIFCHLAKDREK